MEYQNFTDRQTAYNKFLKLRKDVLDSLENGNFFDAFTEVCTSALSGDCVAQDVAAYFFNRGVPNFLQPNYDFYMSWQILAGANGNEFALEKMEFFLNNGIEAIINSEEILTTALRRKNITKDNALMMIANLICEGIVDQLKINPKNLIQISKTAVPYSPQKARVFSEALEQALPSVVGFLIS